MNENLNKSTQIKSAANCSFILNCEINERAIEINQLSRVLIYQRLHSRSGQCTESIVPVCLWSNLDSFRGIIRSGFECLFSWFGFWFCSYIGKLCYLLMVYKLTLL